LVEDVAANMTSDATVLITPQLEQLAFEAFEMIKGRTSSPYELVAVCGVLLAQLALNQPPSNRQNYAKAIADDIEDFLLATVRMRTQ
jgi:hypothetical protein